MLATAVVREISLDNCQLVDPCHRPNACEHGGLCNVDEGRVVCDCTGTGYTGKNCHFGTSWNLQLNYILWPSKEPLCYIRFVNFVLRDNL